MAGSVAQVRVDDVEARGESASLFHGSNTGTSGEPHFSGYHQVPAIEPLSEKNRIEAYLCHRIARFSAVPFSQSRANAYALVVRKSRHFLLAILHLKCIIACRGWIWSTNISTDPLNRS